MKTPEPKLKYKPEDIKFDGCPWHPKQQPGFGVTLIGIRDDPNVYIYAECPICHVKRGFTPTEKEVMEHYESRYSDNKRILRHLLPKLVNAWNWAKKD